MIKDNNKTDIPYSFETIALLLLGSTTSTNNDHNGVILCNLCFIFIQLLDNSCSVSKNPGLAIPC